MNERPDERVARHIVSEALNCPVTRYEDGLQPSQVDALIHYEDNVAALEIVGDHEAAFNQQWDALEKAGHKVHVPGLSMNWSAQLARTASVRRVVKKLPALMQQFQDQLLGVGAPKSHDLPEPFTALGIMMLFPVEHDDPSGVVNLFAGGWTYWPSATNLPAWVGQVLDEQSDVPAKLAAHPSNERHAFIWATIGSPQGIRSQLERQEDGRLPDEPPALPDGVTHVWVAGSSTSLGVLAWGPERGWWRPGWEWPQGVLVLKN